MGTFSGRIRNNQLIENETSRNIELAVFASKVLFTWGIIMIGLIITNAQTVSESLQQPRLVVQTGHSNEISAVAISPSEKLVASVSNDKTVKLWDVQTGRFLTDLKLNESPLFRPTDFARNDFGFVYLLYWNEQPLIRFIRSNLTPRTVELLDQIDLSIPNDEFLHRLTNDLNNILKSNSIYSQELFAGVELSSDTLVLLRNTPRTERSIAELNRSLLNDAFPRDLKKEWGVPVKLTFSPDGSLLALKSWDGDVIVWKVESGEELFTLSSWRSAPMVFSPDGKLLAVNEFRGLITLYDTTTGSTVKRLKRLTSYKGKLYKKEIKIMEFTPNGEQIISVEELEGGRNFNIVYWDIESGSANITPDAQVKSQRNSELLEGVADVLSFDNLESVLIYYDGTNPRSEFVDLYSLSLGSGIVERLVENWSGYYQRATFEIEGRNLIFRQDLKYLTFYSLKDKTTRDVSIENHISAIDFTPDLSLGIIASDTKLLIYNSKEQRIAKEFSSHAIFADTRFDSEGKHLIFEGYLNSFQSLNLVTNTFNESYRDVNIRQNSIFSLNAWDLKSGKHLEKEEIKPQEDGSIISELLRGRMISPDEKWIAVFDDETIYIVDIAMKSVLKALKGHRRPIKFVDFTSDGKHLVSASDDKTLIIWDIDKETVFRKFEKYEPSDLDDEFPESLNTVDSDSKADLIAASTEDGTVTVWTVSTGQEKIKVDHRSVIAVKLDSKNSKLATAGEEGEIKIWELSTGKLITSIEVSTSEDIYSIGFDETGETLVSGGTDKIIRLWDTKTGDLKKSIPEDAGAVHFVGIADNMILSESSRLAIDIVNTETGKNLSTIEGFEGSIIETTLSADRRLLAVEDKSGLKIIDVDNSSKKIVFKKEGKTYYRNGGFQLIDFSSDNANVARLSYDFNHNKSSGNDDLLFLSKWSLEDGRLMYSRSFTDISSSNIRLTLSSSGKWIGLSSISDLILIDTTTDKTPIKIANIFSGNALAFHPSEKYLISGAEEGKIEIREVETQQLVGILSGHSAEILNLQFHPNGKFLLSRSEDGTTRLWDFFNRKEIGAAYLLDNDGWAITTSDGRFDTNRLEDPKGLHWIMPDAPLTPLSFEVFTRDYYEPGLLPRLMKCTEKNNCYGEEGEFKQVRDLTSLNRTQPKIKILDVKPIASSDAVTVTVEAEDILSDYQKDKDKRFLRSGVYDVRLFRDGQIVGHSTTDEQEQSTHRTYNSFDEELRVWQAAHKVALDEDGKQHFTFDVKLPNYKPGTKIEFSAYAFNVDRVKSETSRMTYESKATDTAANRKRKAYIVTFGVNTFQNPSYNLRYAAKDAQVSQEMISKKLKEGGEFSEVVEIPLISEGKQKNATKENAKAVFDLLSGKDVAPIHLKELGSIANKLEAANPDDAVFILFSTHGYGDRNGSFYLLPSNIAPGKGRSFDSSLMQNSISSDELSLWLRDIDASEIVMIIDACNAEWAVKNNNFKPGPMGSRGLGQLSYDKGMKILVATQSANDANEVREIRIDNKNIKVEQGLLTYALIQEGLAGNKADFKPKDNVIKISELLEYAVMRVPTLHESSLAARSSRKDLVNPFPKTERNTQQPYLFDFSKRNDSVLSRIPLSVRK